MRISKNYREEVDDITNINVHSSSFDFLFEEPDLYSLEDVQEPYVLSVFTSDSV